MMMPVQSVQPVQSLQAEKLNSVVFLERGGAGVRCWLAYFVGFDFGR